MRGIKSEINDKVVDGRGFTSPGDNYIREHARPLEYARQRWFKAHPYRGTKAEVGGKK